MQTITRLPRNRRFGWLDDDFDQMFEGFFSPMRVLEESSSDRDLVPAVDVHENTDGYTIHAELPGVRKEDINVTFENGMLTFSAETRNESEEKEGERIIRQERRYGKYLRSLRLGSGIDETGIKANYKDGVLEISVPKAEEVKPKRINVNVG